VRIENVAKAGTLESNDILIMVAPNPKGGINLKIESIVFKQFGKVIEKTIMDKLIELNVEEGIIIAQDKGALDYTIKSRVETAVKRSIC
jgi:citrate lyase subunit gamma (acyl carrier protein)